MNQTRKIRWLLEHEPIELFVRTAEAFDKEIRALTNNTIQVEIWTKDEYTKHFNVSPTKVDPLLLMTTGDIEMTQTQIRNVAQWACPDFFALEMPYLFTDHDHATRVLDGKIGQQLLNSVEETTPAKGLAFTYSGGYRVFAANRAIKTVEDLKGLICLTDINPVRVDTAKAFGLEAKLFKSQNDEPTRDIHKAEAYDQSDMRETTLPRYEAEAYSAGCNYIGVTDHSMFLTSVLINKDFYNSLTLEQQQAIDQTARTIAKLEREWSVADAKELANNTQKHENMGIVYNKFNDAEISKLKELSKPVYEKYRDVFTPMLIDNMIKA